MECVGSESVKAVFKTCKHVLTYFIIYYIYYTIYIFRQCVVYERKLIHPKRLRLCSALLFLFFLGGGHPTDLCMP